MKSTILWAAVFAVFMAEGATAQTSDANSNASSGSQSNSASTSNTVNQPQATANSNQSTTAVSGSASYGNVGNTTTNTMTPTATSNANAQTASESTSNNAGNSQTINFNTNTPPEQRVNTTGRVENVLSGSTTSNQNSTVRSESLSTTRSENVISGDQTVHYEYSGTQTIKNVPSLAAAPLTSSNDTCMGSFSAGVAVPGIGVTGGSTYSDEHCRRIKMSRELWNKGMKAASLALDCMDKDAREALELTGFVCPQTARAQRLAEAAAEQAIQARIAAMPVAQSGHFPPALPAEALALEPVVVQAAPEPAVVRAAPQPAVVQAAPEPAPAVVMPVSEVAPAQPAGIPLAAASSADNSVIVRRLDPVADGAAPRQ